MHIHLKNLKENKKKASHSLFHLKVRKMKALSIVEIVKAVYAIDYTSANRFETIDNVQFDSRLCNENSLFVPLVGTTDGHDYAEKAIANGAQAILWHKEQSLAPENCNVIFVDDTLQAFQKLAHYYKNLLGVRVVGVTGSNGKTTTKDMLAAVLQTQYRIHKTQGNYNNDIGVPKTILDMPEDTQVAVIEMGMDGFNQINQLSKIAEPEISVITLIGDSHLEFLKSREGIAKAKLEILEGMSAEGTLVVPFDEPLLNRTDLNINVKTFGESEQANVSVSNVVTTAQSTAFNVAHYPAVQFTLPVVGTYNAMNAAAAIAVGEHFGITVQHLQEALANFELTANRTQWMDGVNGNTILNDAYNASLTSMSAIINDFQQLNSDKKRYAILGDMRELGENSQLLHEKLADVIQLDVFEHIYLYGEQMRYLDDKLCNREKVTWFNLDKQDELIACVKQHVFNGVILVKSSYGTNLLRVVNALKH